MPLPPSLSLSETPSQASGGLFRTGGEGDPVAQVWLPMAPGLPGARHDDPQVAVIRCHCTRHLFLLLSRRHHPCKLPLPAMTFSPGTKKHPVPLPPPPPPPPAPCQRSGLGLGNRREKSGLGGVSHCLPACHWHNPLGVPYSPYPRLVPWQSGEEGTAQNTVGAGGGPGKAPASPLPGFRKG